MKGLDSLPHDEEPPDRAGEHLLGSTGVGRLGAEETDDPPPREGRKTVVKGRTRTRRESGAGRGVKVYKDERAEEKWVRACVAADVRPSLVQSFRHECK